MELNLQIFRQKYKNLLPLKNNVRILFFKILCYDFKMLNKENPSCMQFDEQASFYVYMQVACNLIRVHFK
jgi:hypothetical protein